MAAAALRILGPRIPLILKTTLYHSLSWTEESSKWDLRTAVIVTTLRSILSGTGSSVSRAQSFLMNAPPVSGPIWVSRVTIPIPPEDDLRQLLFRVIDQLKESELEVYTKCETIPVEAEWNGFRHGVAGNEPEPSGMNEEEKYKRLTKEAESDVTILYIHGGAFYLMDPATHRPTTRKLARLTKGRLFSVRYRLAPQHPFPAAMLDCLTAYLSLLYPPEGSFHEAVKPEHIVFAGDSAGANMCLVLTLFLLHLQRTGQTTVRWHGKDVELPLPAGVSMNSAWCDIARSLPSLHKNAHYDYIPPPHPHRNAGDPFPPHPPPCSIWPATPRRLDFYCDGSMLCHPLVSPLAASRDMWKGAPPMLFISGEEMLEDEIRVMAQRCDSVDVPVRWEMFEAMPHCFAMVLEWRSPRSMKCFEAWAGFISKAAEVAASGKENGREDAKLTGGCFIDYKSGNEAPVDLQSLTALSDDEVSRRMEDERDRMIKDFEEEFGTAGNESTAKL